MRDAGLLGKVVREAGEVFHFAAQVAVTTSLDDPLMDFEVNLRGTLNLLEAIRACDIPPFLLFTSTNKVYGNLQDIALRRNGMRYEPEDEKIRRSGVNESRPLDFHSPYGCSKGAADQYILDYARIYGIPATVFRMSCIYGIHQRGTEDQGWVAHFLLQALRKERITIYGDGRQVRDILFIEDLVEAFLAARKNAGKVRGRVFNMGGTGENTVSLLELLALIEDLSGRKPATDFSDWRRGDQRYYVSDSSSFKGLTGWSPRVGVREGVGRLYGWLKENRILTPPLKKADAAVKKTVGKKVAG